MLLNTRKLVLETITIKNKSDAYTTHFVAGVGEEVVKFEPMVKLAGTYVTALCITVIVIDIVIFAIMCYMTVIYHFLTREYVIVQLARTSSRSNLCVPKLTVYYGQPELIHSSRRK